MCVANEEPGDTSSAPNGIDGTTIVIGSPIGALSPGLDLADLYGAGIVTPDLASLSLVFDGPVVDTIDLSDLASLDDPLQMYGAASYAVLP